MRLTCAIHQYLLGEGIYIHFLAPIHPIYVMKICLSGALIPSSWIASRLLLPAQMWQLLQCKVVGRSYWLRPWRPPTRDQGSLAIIVFLVYSAYLHWVSNEGTSRTLQVTSNDGALTSLTTSLRCVIQKAEGTVSSSLWATSSGGLIRNVAVRLVLGREVFAHSVYANP